MKIKVEGAIRVLLSSASVRVSPCLFYLQASHDRPLCRADDSTTYTLIGGHSLHAAKFAARRFPSGEMVTQSSGGRSRAAVSDDRPSGA